MVECCNDKTLYQKLLYLVNLKESNMVLIVQMSWYLHSISAALYYKKTPSSNPAEPPQIQYIESTLSIQTTINL